MRNPDTGLDIFFAERESIGLEELQSTASFLIRRDRKYIVPRALLKSVLTSIEGNARVLEINNKRSFVYESSYFDTEDLRSYFGALRQRPDRFKVRVRTYCDSGLNFLEAKTRDHRGRTVKQRINRGELSAPELDQSERDWLEYVDQIGPAAASLTHRITTRYLRETLVLPSGDGRVTIDHDVAFSSPEGESVLIPSIAILESKGSGPPTTVDRVLWLHGIRPVAISKFGCGMSLLKSNLPSNRWHRVRGYLASAALC